MEIGIENKYVDTGAKGIKSNLNCDIRILLQGHCDVILSLSLL